MIARKHIKHGPEHTGRHKMVIAFMSGVVFTALVALTVYHAAPTPAPAPPAVPPLLPHSLSGAGYPV